VPNPKTPAPDPGLDALDRQILAELQADGRITNVELARRVNLSAPPCLRRVRRLEDEGVIRGYHADLDPTALGWEVMFFALVGLESQKQSVLDAFGDVLAGGARMPHDPRRWGFSAATRRAQYGA
jgi:DNA-binding Lrp family transcriptional regulator